MSWVYTAPRLQKRFSATLPGSSTLWPVSLDPGPLEAFSTDFTELSYRGGNRKAYLMAVVDLESKYVPGWAVGPSANH